MSDKLQDKIVKQILAIRNTGVTNMFDVQRVSELCDVLGFDELQDFIAKDAHGYCHFILTGKRDFGTI